MKGNILVTGATGFLGAKVCEELIKLDYKVTGIGRKSYGFLTSDVLDSANFNFIHLELKNLNEETFKNHTFTSCIHLASMVEYASHDYHDYHDYSIIPTINIINLAKLGIFKKIVYSSTLSVTTKPSKQKIIDEETPVSPITNYGLSKYICEKLIEIATTKDPLLSCITLRFPAIYGKNHGGGVVHTIKEDAINDREIELYGEGKYLRNILYVDDAVQAIVLAITSDIKGYELFNIGAETSLSVYDITQQLITLLDSNSKVKLSKKPSPNNFNAFLDITKAKEKLHFKPRSIQEGLKLYVQELSQS